MHHCAHSFEYPTVEQAEFLNAQFGAVRCVFNKALCSGMRVPEGVTVVVARCRKCRCINGASNALNAR
ncbi:helix-turn-helix domain-containing protein [Photorhabdus sp. SF281]|uniref:helix-turn-helix domain-containing protein n=1 Tax=Photorhabdus sp. SF281 TaxID=3459527 RepID=UPI004044AB18